MREGGKVKKRTKDKEIRNTRKYKSVVAIKAILGCIQYSRAWR